MKKSYIYLAIGLTMGGFFLSPFFVLATDVCYVDEKADDGGNGSSDNPYKKISKAIDEGCKEIKVAKGTYKEEIVLGKSIKLRGNSRDSVIVEGKIIMKDGAEISKITNISGGLSVVSGADVDIDSVRVKSSNIGIETVGGGKMVLNDSIISGNRKGFYIQKGKNIKITNCKVYDNREEGMDIRADVVGSINNNEIYSNGESGIEVILGKSELSIINNKIKNNDSSGIAAQFYSDTDKLGDVNIKNNVITGSGNFGLDCRAPSGGSGRPKGYWSDSMDLSSNKITDNKKGDIANACKFDEEKVLDATKTRAEREAEILALEEKAKIQRLSLLEKEHLAELEAKKQEEEEIAQKDRAEKSQIDIIYKEAEDLLAQDEIKKDKIKDRNNFLIFFVGEDYREIKNLQDGLFVYDEKIKNMEDKKSIIVDENILNDVSDDISTLREKREDLANFIQNRGNDFSIWGWLFEKIYLSNDENIFWFFKFA
jgi:parallel beta-helix repeat protein